ncbi:MAG: hypothetical protein JW809_19235 [Pirellulales bacterium]|nr:hypothetical protein [Pirellulales bacterium]
MGNGLSLVEFLDLASEVASLAHELGQAFQEEFQKHDTPVEVIDPSAWDRHKPVFERLYRVLVDLTSEIQDPPNGAEVVADHLRETAKIAKTIRDGRRSQAGRDWATYRESFPLLNSVSHELHAAIKDVHARSDEADPLDALVAVSSADAPPINTTPADLPQPSDSLVDAAARAVPRVLADVKPGREKEVAVVASALIEALRKQGHTLQAACWAIHRLVGEGKLHAAPIVKPTPFIGTQTPGQPMKSFPGAPGPGTWKKTKAGDLQLVIPECRSAPFHAFRVVATESLWRWWREIEAENQRAGSLTAGPSGAPGSPAPAGKATGRKRRRGPRPKYDAEHDAKVARDWAAAKRQGACKNDFAREKGLSIRDLNKALTRVRKRKTRAD